MARAELRQGLRTMKFEKPLGRWPAPDSMDTDIGVTLEPGEDHWKEKDIQPRVQTRGDGTGTGSRHVGCAGSA
jgi:hypothetical protein